MFRPEIESSLSKVEQIFRKTSRASFERRKDGSLSMIARSGLSGFVYPIHLTEEGESQVYANMTFPTSEVSVRDPEGLCAEIYKYWGDRPRFAFDRSTVTFSAGLLIKPKLSRPHKLEQEIATLLISCDLTVALFRHPMMQQGEWNNQLVQVAMADCTSVT